MFIAVFEASGGNDFMTVGATEQHAIKLMRMLWEAHVEEYGPFRFKPVVDDINIIEMEVGQGVIDYDVRNLR